MKRLSFIPVLIVLFLSTYCSGQYDLTKAEITTDLPNDSALSSALPRLIPMSDMMCSSYPASVTFRLYSHESDVAPVWQETQVINQHPGSYDHIACWAPQPAGCRLNYSPRKVLAGLECNVKARRKRRERC